MVADIVTVVLVTLGLVFFSVGTVGLLRFPDLRSRVHALTKADNVGLGLIVLGLIVQASSMAVAGKLVLVWLLALIAASTSAVLLASGDGDSDASDGTNG
ncbi:monovalent cation/H(+) antiporter subunit G [Hoyosella rhizosphaerae]|nr:monovalent cation/H(+) antiporter subunit G [Hoyosella rhizosphaerae]